MGVAKPQNLTVADNMGRPTSTVISPSSDVVAGGGESENIQNPSQFSGVDSLFAHTVKPFVQLPVQFAENYANTFANLGNRAAGGQNRTIQQNMGTDPVSRAVLGFSDATGTNRQLLGDVGQIGALTLGGAAERAGSLAGKAGIDALAGGVFGAGQTASDNPNATIGDYFKNAAIGAGAGAGLRLAGGLISKLKVNPASVGLTKDTLNFVKNSNNADEIHALLSSIYGGSNDALKAASEALANSDSKRFIIHTLEDLPLEAAGSTVLGAAASDAVAREKYGNSPLTGETAPKTEPQPTTPKEIQLGPQGPAEGAPGIKLNAAKLPAEDVAAIEAAGAKVPQSEVGSTAAKAAAETPKPSELPAEDVAAIKAAGAEPSPAPENTPAPKLAENRKLPPEDIAAIQQAGGDIGKVQEVKSAKEAQTAKGQEAQTPAVQESSTAQQAVAANSLPPEDEAAIQATGGDVNAAKQQIKDSLTGATREYNKADKLRSADRASRSAAAEDAYWAAGGGEAGMRAKLAALRGKYAESGFNPIGIDEQSQQAILNDVAQSDMRPFEKTNTQNALRKIWGANEGKPTPSDINYIRNYLGDDAANAIQDAIREAPQSWREKAAENLGQVAGLPKSLMASLDLSATLRQGGILASRFPREMGQAFKDQLKYFSDPEFFKQDMARIASKPNYQEKLDAGLALTGTEALDEPALNSEEQFVSNLAEKIPGIGRAVAASDRGYTGFLTDFRDKVYDRIVNAERAAGRELTQEDLDGIAKFINTSTGRGDFGKLLEKHAGTLSTALFSPRLWVSRLQVLNPLYYHSLPPVARKYALQSAATFAGEASTILGLMSLVPGVSVNLDPRSADFAKIKYKNTRYDILGGLQQNIVFAYRELTGEKTNSETGKTQKFARGITDLFKKNPPPVDKSITDANRLSIIGDMVQNKENPLFATAGQILKGKDRGGHPVNPITALAQLAVPLSLSGIAQTTQDIGSLKNPGDVLKGIALNSPDVVGISAQTYGSIPSKNQGKANPQGLPTYDGPVQPNMVTDLNGKVMIDDKGQPITVNFKGDETALEKKAMLNKARDTAYNKVAISKLSKSDAEIYKVGTNDPSLLNDQQKAKFAELKKWVTDYGRTQKVPDGAASDLAKTFFQKYNSMTKDDQKAWLNQPADQNATTIAKQVNAQRSKGLDEFKPSNKLAQLYAKYEVDLNSHPEYTDVDKRNKAKAFQINAAKLNYNQNVGDIFSEGGSQDLKTLIENKKIDKNDLANAIALDNQLYTAGLESSLKFSKKFRTTYGYGVPALYGSGGKFAYGSGSGGGSGSGRAYSQQLSNLVFTPKALAAPKFKSAARANPGNTIKFRAPQNAIPGKGSSRVTASPYRTATTTRLRNSVGI